MEQLDVETKSNSDNPKTVSLPTPASEVVGKIWLLIVGAIAFVMILSLIFLGLGINKEVDFFAIVLATLTFLGGLLSPSPIKFP